MTRTAEIARTTNETDVRLALALDGAGRGERATGVGFLDHMLDLLARHARIDLDVGVTGDLQTGAHHTAEDTGLALGQALDEALGDRAGIYRYGHAVFDFMEAEWGKDSVRDFIFEFRSFLGRDVSVAIRRTFDIDPDEFDLRFRRYAALRSCGT